MQELLQLPIALGNYTLPLLYISQGPGSIHYRAIPKSSNFHLEVIPWLKFSLPYEISIMPPASSMNSYTILLLCSCSEPLNHPNTPHLQHTNLTISRDIFHRCCNKCDKAYKTCVVFYNADYYLNIELELYEVQLKLFNYNTIMILLPRNWESISVIHL
jgi:hypothetical protein